MTPTTFFRGPDCEIAAHARALLVICRASYPLEFKHSQCVAVIAQKRKIALTN